MGSSRAASLSAAVIRVGIQARVHVGVLAGVLVVGAGGCQTNTCDALAARAKACDGPDTRWVDTRDSVCFQVRQQVGVERFDSYADCVHGTECQETDAINVCMEESIAGATSNPCLRFRLWAAACGLEPAGAQGNCAGVAAGGDLTFGSWVDCITRNGCPEEGDDRYNQCQNLVPNEINEMLQACRSIEEWTTECQGQTVEQFPVQPITLNECIAQSVAWTVQSYIAYVDCLTVLDCNDTAGRLACILLLRAVNLNSVTPECQRLVDYGNTCANGVGGGTLEACKAIFSRFTKPSVTAYTDCLTGRPCSDVGAGNECAAALVVR